MKFRVMFSRLKKKKTKKNLKTSTLVRTMYDEYIPIGDNPVPDSRNEAVFVWEFHRVPTPHRRMCVPKSNPVFAIRTYLVSGNAHAERVRRYYVCRDLNRFAFEEGKRI